MTEEPKSNPNREAAIRTAAIDMAIRSGCGNNYNNEGRVIVEASKIIDAAKQFETYIKDNNK